MIGRCTHVVDCRATGGMGKGGGLAQRGTFAECGAEVLAVAMSPGRRHITKPVCEITFGLRESNVLTSTMVLNAGAGVLMMLQLLVVHYLVSLIRKWNK